MAKGKITSPRVYKRVYLNQVSGQAPSPGIVVLYKIDYFVLYVCTSVLLFVCLLGFRGLFMLSERENEVGAWEVGRAGGVKG